MTWYELNLWAKLVEVEAQALQGDPGGRAHWFGG